MDTFFKMVLSWLIRLLEKISGQKLENMRKEREELVEELKYAEVFLCERRVAKKPVEPVDTETAARLNLIVEHISYENPTLSTLLWHIVNAPAMLMMESKIQELRGEGHLENVSKYYDRLEPYYDNIKECLEMIHQLKKKLRS